MVRGCVAAIVLLLVGPTQSAPIVVDDYSGQPKALQPLSKQGNAYYVRGGPRYTGPAVAGPSDSQPATHSEGQIARKVQSLRRRLAEKEKDVGTTKGSIEVVGPLAFDFDEVFAEAVAWATGCEPSEVTVLSSVPLRGSLADDGKGDAQSGLPEWRPSHGGDGHPPVDGAWGMLQKGKKSAEPLETIDRVRPPRKGHGQVFEVNYQAPPYAVDEVWKQCVDPDSRLSSSKLHWYLVYH